MQSREVSIRPVANTETSTGCDLGDAVDGRGVWMIDVELVLDAL